MYGNMDTPELRALAGETLRPFRILIIGPQGSGKSSLAAALGKCLGFEVGETSAFLMERAAISEALRGVELGKAEAWFSAKDALARRILLDEGDKLTDVRADYLLEKAAEGGRNILCGARRKIELEAWFLNGRNAQDVLLEIMVPDAQDDAYELANFKREENAAGGRTYRIVKSLINSADLALRLAAMIISDKQEQAKRAAW